MKPLAELFLKPGKPSKKMIRESAKRGPSSEHGATAVIFTLALDKTHGLRFKLEAVWMGFIFGRCPLSTLNLTLLFLLPCVADGGL